MVDYISKIIFGKGLDQNDGSCDNRSKQASKHSVLLPVFSVKPQNTYQKAYCARFL